MKVIWKNEDYVEVRSEDSDVEQEVSNEQSEDGLGMSEECFFGKDEKSK